MADLNDPNAHWWRNAVVYQIYVRSFADSDGDGIGDLPGITSRLPHLADLGVDALWITPFYTSPQHDHGYDVADYRDVDPLFGTLSDADDLIARAHELGLRVVVDLVPNHTSDEHAWFQAALAAGPGSPERARYLFRDSPEGEPAGTPPNNWQSVFGGPAWTQVDDGQWYLHLFDSTPARPRLAQPRGPGDVRGRAALLARPRRRRLPRRRGPRPLQGGVAARPGRRGGRASPPSRSTPTTDGRALELTDEPMWDQPEVHDVYRSWHEILDEAGADRMAVAEAWTQTAESMATFVRPDELDQAFNFAWLLAEWSAETFAEVITDTLAAVDAGRRLADVGAQQPRRRPPRHPLRRRRAGPGPRPRSHADDARAARLELPLPGRGARPRAGRRRPGGPPGPVVPPHRRGRPRRLPGADPVERHRGAVRLRAGLASSRGSRSRPTGRRSRSRRRPATRPRRWSSTATRCGLRRDFAWTAGEEVELLDLGTDVLAFRRGPLTVVLNCGDDPGRAARGRAAAGQRAGRGRQAAPRHGRLAPLTPRRRSPHQNARSGTTPGGAF